MDANPPAAELAPFDPASLRDNSLLARVLRWGLDHLGPVFAVLRRFWPNLRLSTLVILTGREDVEAVLADTEAFHVRFGTRVADQHPGRGPVFGLGTDGASYAPALKQVSATMGFGDLPWVAGMLRGYVAPQVATAQCVDLGALARLAQAELGRRYLGLSITPEVLPQFALWCLAMGNYAFGPQKPGSKAETAARGAGERVAALMQVSIAHARVDPDPDMLLGRLIAVGLDDATIDATLTGLLCALVPASTLAILHSAQVLLARPEAMAVSRAAALADDDEALGRCLLEAVRFKPIFPGPFRDCVMDRIIADGTSRKILVRAGDLVLPATQSAMMDRRRVTDPGVFNPGRPAADTLVFGFGRHWCFGFAVGQIQLVETLKPLLKRGFSQSRTDRADTRYFGTVPEHLPVQLG